MVWSWFSTLNFSKKRNPNIGKYFLCLLVKHNTLKLKCSYYSSSPCLLNTENFGGKKVFFRPSHSQHNSVIVVIKRNFSGLKEIPQKLFDKCSHLCIYTTLTLIRVVFLGIRFETGEKEQNYTPLSKTR